MFNNYLAAGNTKGILLMMSITLSIHGEDYTQLDIDNTSRGNCIDSRGWVTIAGWKYPKANPVLITAKRCPKHSDPSQNIVCSGFDLDELVKHRECPEMTGKLLQMVMQAFTVLKAHRASVQCFLPDGLVLCAGVGFAAVSDRVIASSGTYFQLPEDSRMRAVARALIPLTLRNLSDWDDGKPITAQHALKLGLVDIIVQGQASECFLKEFQRLPHPPRNLLKDIPNIYPAPGQIPKAIHGPTLDNAMAFLNERHAMVERKRALRHQLGQGQHVPGKPQPPGYIIEH